MCLPIILLGAMLPTIEQLARLVTFSLTLAIAVLKVTKNSTPSSSECLNQSNQKHICKAPYIAGESEAQKSSLCWSYLLA